MSNFIRWISPSESICVIQSNILKSIDVSQVSLCQPEQETCSKCGAIVEYVLNYADLTSEVDVEAKLNFICYSYPAVCNNIPNAKQALLKAILAWQNTGLVCYMLKLCPDYCHCCGSE